MKLFASLLRIHLPCILFAFGPLCAGSIWAAVFDAAPFGLPLPEGNGLIWEDPREIYQVVVQFKGEAPAVDKVKLEYWGSWWPERHLPKDREPGGGEMGWMELGNWYKYGWRTADAVVDREGAKLTFGFRPVTAKEFPKVADYPATFRYTLKIRVASTEPAEIVALQALTSSTLENRAVRLAWQQPRQEQPVLEAFNGKVEGTEKVSPTISRVRLQVTANTDPNTFDRTLVTVRTGKAVFTFKVDDLANGALYLPEFGVAILPDTDTRDYSSVADAQKPLASQSLYDRVAAMPEQNWRSAWESIPRKKSRIYFPLGLDGGRQRFRVNADGSLNWRYNDHFLRNRPGKDSARLRGENGPWQLRFDFSGQPSDRTLAEESLPICITTWDRDGIRVQQTVFVTALEGTIPDGPTPAGDTHTISLVEFVFSNTSTNEEPVELPLRFSGSDFEKLRVDEEGLIWNGETVRGQVVSEVVPLAAPKKVTLSFKLSPGAKRTIVCKIPYLTITETAERQALTKLEYTAERKSVADYWRRRLDKSARLVTPEPMLNEFYRSHAMHLLVNCEREPNSDRRFARVGSFSYGAYGNESCMMVVDLDRRGYHKEAQDCLDAWLHYQGTVKLPGDFASQEGILYGAGGYEAGGYNQHHGWILWMLAEHYRFTRDGAWLQKSAPGLLKAADWIINETARTVQRHELERGLLPAGSLEDIGDWWTWLSTSCYTWRGLDSAAWALEQIAHPDAVRIRKAADAYHQNLLQNFRAAAARSPVVRLRDGTAVPHFPSQVHRRGRSFGWICETLEGALHLLITKAIDPSSQEATWILKDYEDNLYLSNQYGYTVEDFEKHWFGRGGMSMQACLLLDVEPYLYRDDVKHALRALFNGQSVSYFPDVRMNTEHALPNMDDWRGDHFKSSDEANCAGWLRHIFVREDGNNLLLGQAVPGQWLAQDKKCGIENASTYYGSVNLMYAGGREEITAIFSGAKRNTPASIRLRFREAAERRPVSVLVNGKPWKELEGEWVILPGNIGAATIVAKYSQ